MNRETGSTPPNLPINSSLTWNYDFYQEFLGKFGVISAAFELIFYYCLKYLAGYEESAILRFSTVLLVLGFSFLPADKKLKFWQKLYIEFTWCISLPVSFYSLLLMNQVNSYWFASMAFCGFIHGLVTVQILGLSIYGTISLLIILGIRYFPEELGSINTTNLVLAHVVCVITYILSSLIRGMLQVGYQKLLVLNAEISKKTIELNNELKSREAEIKLKAEELVRTKISLEMEQIKVAHLDEINTITAQVSHDIRSPVAALEMISEGLKLASEDHRIIVRSAIRRISDIAHMLLVKNRAYYAEDSANIVHIEPGAQAVLPSTEMVAGLLDSILAEKRTEFRRQVGINIISVFNSDAYGIFSSIVSLEFKRVLSNLVNNAVEALDGAGVVEIFLSSDARDAILEIRDNGKGIAPELIPRLMRKGATFNKMGGTGLGLFHAREAARMWNGDLQLKSLLGRGTSIFLSLPLAPEPAWFVPELRIAPGSRIAIIDDDATIHQIWIQRLNTERVKRHRIELFHFSSPEQLLQLKAGSRPTLYLCDYEFAQQNQNGIDLLIKLNILNQSILVTSHYEDRFLLERCLTIGLRVLPKGMTGFVPIRFDETTKI
jgi:signal transduction histidine kinase